MRSLSATVTSIWCWAIDLSLDKHESCKSEGSLAPLTLPITSENEWGFVSSVIRFLTGALRGTSCWGDWGSAEVKGQSLKTSDRQKRQFFLVLFGNLVNQFRLHSCPFHRLLHITAVHLVFPLCIYLTLDLQHSVQYFREKLNSFPGVLAYVI